MSQFSPGASDDSRRLELTMAASSAERANKPSFLIILALVVLAGSLIYVITGVSARISASTDVSRAAVTAQSVIKLVADVRANAAGPRDERFGSDPRLASKIEELAAEMNLKLAGTVTTSDSGQAAPVAGFQQKKLSAKAVNEDPRVALAWLEATQDRSRFPGLDIYNLRLNPGGSSSTPAISRPTASLDEPAFTGGWDFTIDFVRWERKGN